jgi:hypothetical protein
MSLEAFLLEFFHPEHGAHDRTVVVLSEDALRPDVSELLRLPRWEQRVMYLQGSSMREHDLRRTSIESAAAVFVATRKASSDAADADGEVVLRVLSVRACARSVPMYVQLRRSAAAFYIQEQADHIMPLDRIKYAALAQACICPGLIALLSNMIRTHGEPKTMGEPWLREYVGGMSHEVYRMPFSRDFIGQTFSDSARVVYRQLGLTLLAVETNSFGDSEPHLLLNPGRAYTIMDGDMALVFAHTREDALPLSRFIIEAETASPSVFEPLEKSASALRPLRPAAGDVDLTELHGRAIADQLAMTIAARPAMLAEPAAPRAPPRLQAVPVKKWSSSDSLGVVRRALLPETPAERARSPAPAPVRPPRVCHRTVC